MFDFISYIPWLTAIGGVLWGVISGHSKRQEKRRRKAAEFNVIVEKKRADIAEETTKVIVDSEKIAREKVDDARNKAKSSRGRFTQSSID